MDCQALKTSEAPYELQMRQADDRRYPVQVYRGDNLTRTQYTKVADHLVISRFQANFQLEYQDLAGLDVRFTYSVPTDRYIWQQDSLLVTYNTIVSGAAAKGPGVTQTYEMLPDTVFALGECSFPVKRFRFKQSSPDQSLDEEIWFSPELQTNLRLTAVTTLPHGKTTSRKLEAVSLTTTLASFK